MKISTLRVTCSCGHVFDAEIVIEAPLTVAMASMQAARCPKCGSDKLGLGGSYDDAPPLSSPVAARAAWWRERGETGTSSLTIWVAFTGGRSPHSYHCYPLDPSDFRRCKQLLDLIPEWRSEMAKVSEKFPWFNPFVERWSEFERLYTAEAPSNSCPQLYALMKTAAREADAIRYRGSDGKGKS